VMIEQKDKRNLGPWVAFKIVASLVCISH
jgi:hypothetical protein